MFEECDGIVMNSSPSLESEGIKAYQTWMGNRPVINPCPLDFPIVEPEPDQSSEALEVKAFMDNALKKHGAKSLVYVRALHQSSISEFIIMIYETKLELRCRLEVFGGRLSPRRSGQLWMS